MSSDINGLDLHWYKNCFLIINNPALSLFNFITNKKRISLTVNLLLLRLCKGGERIQTDVKIIFTNI